MAEFDLPGFDVAGFVAAALAEDLGIGLPGGGHDVTSESVIPEGARFSGVMDNRDAIIVAGLPIAAAFFRKLDAGMEIELLAGEGQAMPPGSDLMRLTGNARAMLTAERSALNTVQHLSGIATMTRQYVDAMGNAEAVLLDTRKTIPGLRIGEAVRRAKAAGVVRIICEVDSIAQIEPALAAGASHLLLDNMSVGELREAVALVAGRVPCEASGGVRLDTIGAIAATGVDFISVGRLTQSAPAADIGLDFAVL